MGWFSKKDKDEQPKAEMPGHMVQDENGVTYVIHPVTGARIPVVLQPPESSNGYVSLGWPSVWPDLEE